MCALSAMTVGTRSSATAVALLSTPEEDETDEAREDRPAQGQGPELHRRRGQRVVVEQGMPLELDVDQQRVGLDQVPLPAVRVGDEPLHWIEDRGGVHPD